MVESVDRGQTRSPKLPSSGHTPRGALAGVPFAVTLTPVWSLLVPPTPEEPLCWPHTLMPLKVRGCINRRCEDVSELSALEGEERGGGQSREEAREG